MYHGIINVYKEAGYTSFDAIAKLRRILGQRKIGHTGTLDPEAKGVLPICLGAATKACDYLLDHIKTYRAVLLLGITTDTEDIFGEVLTENSVNVAEDAVREAVNSFKGRYEQLPPMYSAIKINGQKLCDVARSGKSVERKLRTVEIIDINIEKIELPRVYFEITCGKGTYIRSLCRDIGEKLGCGGCMEELERTAVGIFKKEDAFKLDQIDQMHRTGCLEQHIIKTDALFQNYQAMHAKPKGDKYLYNGNPVYFDHLKKTDEKPVSAEIRRMYFSDSSFAGLYKADLKRRRMYPEKVFLETLFPIYRAIAVGKFDGCHEGHRALFKKLKEITENTDTESMLLVIDSEGEHILSDEERFLCASEYGINRVEKICMDENFMRMSPEDFIKDILIQRFHVKDLVVGRDFRFGYQRSGDAELLTAAGEKYGFETHVVEEECLNGRKISSTWIRDELKAGNLRTAKLLLGDDYRISGTVIHGNHIGHRMHFPTINISCEGKTKIPFGVYAVQVTTDKGVYKGIANYGIKPTVTEKNDILLEANLFDCDAELYDTFAVVRLLEFVRPEMRFPSLEALAAQIEKDIEYIKEYFKKIDI